MTRGGSNPLLEAALAYAERGWPVLPCNNANKQPLVAALKGGDGKPVKGTGGVSKASIDPEEIKAWWRKWPFAMIGLAMGRNGLFALDFDPRVIEEVDPATGAITEREFTLEQLKAETEEQIGTALPATLAVRTPSGGVHLYFRQPEEGAAIRNRGNLPDHVDVRGAGGYVIAPPSFLEDGRSYRWLHGASHAPVAEAPAELIAELRAPKRKPAATPATNDAAAAQAAPSSSSSSSSSAEDPVEAAVRRYALAALDEECRRLAATPVGNRNNQCNASGFAMGQLVGAGALTRATARAALIGAVQLFNVEEATAAIDNGLDAGEASPRDLAAVRDTARDRADRFGRGRGSSPSRTLSSESKGGQSSRRGGSGFDDGDRGPGDGDEDRDPADLNRKCAFYPQTDLGNLERFLARYGRDFLFVEQWGWLAWDGRRWSRDLAVPLLGHAVQLTVRQIQEEAKFIRESGWKIDTKPASIEGEEREGGLDFIAKWKGKEPVAFSTTVAAWGRTSESSGHISAIPKMAEARLSARTYDFDADPLKLNVENGTLEFERAEEGFQAKGRRREFRREDLITKMAEVEFDPSAECPLFDRFLEEVQPDPEMRQFLDVWAGYNMLGLADAQKMAVFHGQGSNGKGVWIQTIAHILGDYAWAAAIETFIDQGRYRKGSDASPDLAALAGRRMVYANEPEEGAKFSDGLIKAMTSDEPIGGVRELMKPPFELLVTFTNTVSANHKPKIGTDHGIQRRMQLIPLGVIIADDRADPQLKNKLKAEASGIFNRMIRGAIEYLTTGLSQPEAIKAATKEYLEENDLLGQFLALVVVDAPGEKLGATDLHRIFAAWQTWANQLPASGKPWSAKYLNGQMQRKGFRILKSSTMQWQDIATRYEEGDFIDHDGRARSDELRAPRETAAADPPADDDAAAFIPGGGA